MTLSPPPANCLWFQRCSYNTMNCFQTLLSNSAFKTYRGYCSLFAHTHTPLLLIRVGVFILYFDALDVRPVREPTRLVPALVPTPRPRVRQCLGLTSWVSNGCPLQTRSFNSHRVTYVIVCRARNHRPPNTPHPPHRYGAAPRRHALLAAPATSPPTPPSPRSSQTTTGQRPRTTQQHSTAA